MKKLSEIGNGIQITEKGSHLDEPRTAIIEANNIVSCQLSFGGHFFIEKLDYETLVHGFLSLDKTGFSCEEENILDGFGYYVLIKKGSFYSPVYIFWNINDTCHYLSNLILSKIKIILTPLSGKDEKGSIDLFSSEEKNNLLSLEKIQKIDKDQGWSQIVRQWKNKET